MPKNSKVVQALCLALILGFVLPPAGALAAPVDKTRMTVFILPEGPVTQKATAEISHALVGSLRENKHLTVKDPDKLLVEFAGEVPNAEIAEGKDTLARGLKLLKAGNAVEAEEQLQLAVAGLEPHLAFLKKSVLAQAAMALGVAQATQGKKPQAVMTFLGLLVWRPKLGYDTSRFPSRFLPLWIKAHKAMKKRRKGSAELRTTPPGAKAYVDGRFVGVTPTTSFGLRAGTHYATYKMAGYVKAAQKIKVSGTLQQRYDKELNRSDKFLLLKQTLNSVKVDLGKDKATPSMVDLRSFLFIDQVLFARVLPGEDKDQIVIKAYLYDLRSRMRLNQATTTVTDSGVGNLADLSQAIYLNARYDGTLATPEEPAPPPPPKRTPFYATWWFWTAVGVGVAGVVTAALVWPDTRSCAENFRCVTIGN